MFEKGNWNLDIKGREKKENICLEIIHPLSNNQTFIVWELGSLDNILSGQSDI